MNKVSLPDFEISKPILFKICYPSLQKCTNPVFLKNALKIVKVNSPVFYNPIVHGSDYGPPSKYLDDFMLNPRIKGYALKESNRSKVSNIYFDKKLSIFIEDKSYTSTLIRMLLLLVAGDVERNPGPEDITLVTQNCRGLKNKDKLKQLLNRLSNMKIGNTKIVALQETHLDLDQSYIKYMWSGVMAITPGVGSKGGVVTLLSGNISIHEQIDVENEGHILLAELISNKDAVTLIIANLHSPCAHDGTKIAFFSKILNTVTDLKLNHDNCEVIIMGDFNTTFWSSDRINTVRSRSEIKVAEEIKAMFLELNLRDCWNEFDKTMTWRHGDKMSRIDRIQWSDSLDLIHKSTITDWTITTSDHSAVIVELKAKKLIRKTNAITRIDTAFLNNVKLRSEFLSEINQKVQQLEDTNLDPHGRLEFLKVAIRSAAIEIATNHKKKMEQEFNEIQKEMNFWQTTFENGTIPQFKQSARENLDILMARRDKYLSERGKYLSERSKSKWYQEGERSTKYFLNLNRARCNKNEMSDLEIDGNLINDPQQINKYVEQFYSNLYGKGDKSLINEGKLESFLNNLGVVPDEKIQELDRKLTVDELYNTLKSCSDSAPGPDGIPYSLIKLTWNHFGKLLLDSWHYAEDSGDLTRSHDSSYLRLLPKVGKDTRILKNWRPITLSNCDFKLITKTLSWRLSKAIEGIINPCQTAYLKGRQISDNLNVMLYSLEHTAEESGMLISLDAEKAFDSIEHWYIKKVLSKIGLGDFIKTFDVIYKNQKVDIILNGALAGKYQIKNGVKQGDALSCVLFILGVEPLLKNINDDPDIKHLRIKNTNIPRAIAYADDISCLIKAEQASLQKVFDHYDVLTSLSGLKLNAEKTEIIDSGGSKTYEVTYGNNRILLSTCDKIKVNGLILSYDLEEARKLNIAKMMSAVTSQLRGWSNRNLSILGKIQIFKTFGLSQILFTLSTTRITKSEEKALTNLIYKFIWNRNMDTNKAPDRIKRQVLLNRVKDLGFGMIDFREVVKGIRLRNIFRILNSGPSPMEQIIRNSVSNSLINIELLHPIREPVDSSIKQLKLKWLDFIEGEARSCNPGVNDIIQKEYLGNLVQKKFRKNRLVRHHRNDRIAEIDSTNPVLQKLHPKILLFINSNQSNRTTTHDEVKHDSFPHKSKIIVWPKITSKIIRSSNLYSKIQVPKMITNCNSDLLTRLGSTISTLTNTKLKSIILRCLHGDVYSKERMFRFGMTEDNLCQRCSQIETTNHMLFECVYTKTLWSELAKLTGITPHSINEILGIDPKHDKISLTIHSETLRRLLSIDRPTIDPKTLIKSVFTHLNTLERGVTKYQVSKLLETLNRDLT